MKKYTFIPLLFFAFLLLLNNGCSQKGIGTIGIIYTSEEADSLYGNVLESIDFDSDVIENLLLETDDYIMFMFKNREVIIADYTRKCIYNCDYKIEENDTMNVYSNSKIVELISLGGEIITKIEKRAEVITVTNGNSTLEYSVFCPPICP